METTVQGGFSTTLLITREKEVITSTTFVSVFVFMGCEWMENKKNGEGLLQTTLDQDVRSRGKWDLGSIGTRNRT